jgi:hypothetical protein
MLGSALVRAQRALGVGFAQAIFSAVAAAAPPEPAPFSLTVTAPPECPSTEALRAEVLRLARVGTDSPRRLDAIVVVTQTADGHFALELRTDLEGVSGERSFEGSSCQAVSDAAALTLALMLNPEVGREEPVEAAAEPAPAKAEPAAAASPPPPSAPPPKPALPGPRFRGTVAVFGGVQGGILPEPGFDLGASFGVSLEPVSLWLGVSYDPEQDARLSGSTAGATLSAGSARLLGCWDFSRSEDSIGPCAGAELGRIEGFGAGISDPQGGNIYWTSAVLGLSASLELWPPVHVYATLSALVTVDPPQVYLEGIGKVHEPAGFAARSQVGAAIDLW